MKLLRLAPGLLAGALLAAPAAAQTPVTVYRYCLQIVDESGNHPLMCRFHTFEQCLASRTWAGDRCVASPWYVPSSRRR
jgi:hypothetical protein